MPKLFGSLVSRVAVTDAYKVIAHLSKSLHFSSRSLPGILSGYISFYHELHEWTNDTNLFRFSIREIRSFVKFVISKHLISHHHNPSTRYLQRELPESQIFTANRNAKNLGYSTSLCSCLRTIFLKRSLLCHISPQDFLIR